MRLAHNIGYVDVLLTRLAVHSHGQSCQAWHNPETVSMPIVQFVGADRHTMFPVDTSKIDPYIEVVAPSRGIAFCVAEP